MNAHSKTNRASEYAAMIALALMTLAVTAAAMSWRGITPLVSDKQTVRARLGTPHLETHDRMEFTNKQGKVIIFFYTEEDVARFNLSSKLIGKVLTIYFYPRRPRSFNRADLVHKVISVGRGVTLDGEPMTSYDDGEHGISYQFKGDETRVWRIVYYGPRAKFAKFKLAENDN
jgi:hypothetical protein